MNLTQEQLVGSQKVLDIIEPFMVANSTVGRGIIDGLVIESRYVLVTPALAEKLLGLNINNRPINNDNVKKIRKELANGNWIFNGAPIRCDFNGHLRDGQNRLTAIKEERQSVPVLIVTGLLPDSFKTMDSGRGRSGSDTLHVDGVKNSVLTASTCKFIWAFKKGRYSVNRQTDRTLTNPEISAFNKANEEKLTESVQFAMGLNRKVDKSLSPKLSPTDLAGFHFLLTEIDAERAEDFLTKVYSGIGLEDKSPITVLRNKLLKPKLDETYKLGNEEKLKSIMYCWEKYLAGTPMRILKLPKDYEIKLN
jgi:hypothetical protein